MRVLIQRVRAPRSRSPASASAATGRGFLALVGVTHGDTADAAARLAGKTARLRVFNDEAGLMNLALPDVGGEVLAVSQFTLYADARKGNRPSFVGAAPRRTSARPCTKPTSRRCAPRACRCRPACSARTCRSSCSTTGR